VVVRKTGLSLLIGVVLLTITSVGATAPLVVRCIGESTTTWEDLAAKEIQTRIDLVIPEKLNRLMQWSGQKSGGDSAVRSEFVIAGMIFHPSRVKSQLLHKYIEQSFVELTLLPACHREDVWFLALRHAHILSADQIERRQRGIAMKI
jgi:hypothetical protein